jgi:mannose-6-phosphate isomerase
MTHEYYPLLFQPNFRTVVWGGSGLPLWKNQPLSDEPIGESWEVSAVPANPSIIANGPLAGRDLISVISQSPEPILGHAVAQQYNEQLPLLVKFIDAKRDLSIQVHPDDAMAHRHHLERGKSEMWYVIKADPGAYLYAGFKEEITIDEYRRRISEGTITEVLAKHHVKAGDVFYIPAGRVHAICGGILLAEIQQSSDTTYRIFDYNRVGLDGHPRQLHTDLAAEALDFHVEANYQTIYRNASERANPILDTPYFSVRIVDFAMPFHRNLLKYDSFIITTCIKGGCILRIRKTHDEVQIREGYSCLIPACVADYDLLPLNGATKMLDTFIDNKPHDLSAMITKFLHLSN